MISKVFDKIYFIIVLPQPVNPTKANEKWEQIAREFKEDDPQGEAALNALFQKIYGESNEDVRRAMNKSFVCALFFSNN